jgi:hypothetical protein
LYYTFILCRPLCFTVCESELTIIPYLSGFTRNHTCSIFAKIAKPTISSTEQGFILPKINDNLITPNISIHKPIIPYYWAKTHVKLRVFGVIREIGEIKTKN